jgi:hypothetical protein
VLRPPEGWPTGPEDHKTGVVWQHPLITAFLEDTSTRLQKHELRVGTSKEPAYTLAPTGRLTVQACLGTQGDTLQPPAEAVQLTQKLLTVTASDVAPVHLLLQLLAGCLAEPVSYQLTPPQVHSHPGPGRLSAVHQQPCTPAPKHTLLFTPPPRCCRCCCWRDQNCMCMGGNFFSSRRSTRSAMPPANLDTAAVAVAANSAMLTLVVQTSSV